jgi:hypothetical protein
MVDPADVLDIDRLYAAYRRVAAERDRYKARAERAERALAQTRTLLRLRTARGPLPDADRSDRPTDGDPGRHPGGSAPIPPLSLPVSGR